MAQKIASPSLRLKVRPLTQDAFAQYGTVINESRLDRDVADGIHQSNATIKPVQANQGTAIKWPHVTHLTDHYHLALSGVKAKPSVSLFHCDPRTLRNDEDIERRIKAYVDAGNAVESHTDSQRQSVEDYNARQTQSGVFDVQILERHPFTSQTFVPMGLSAYDYHDTCYMVIVAPTLPPPNGQSGDSQSSPSLPKGSGLPNLRRMEAFLARGDQAVTYAAGTWHAPMITIGRFPIDFVVWQYANDVANEDCQEVRLEPQGKDFDGVVVPVPSSEERSDILQMHVSYGRVKL